MLGIEKKSRLYVYLSSRDLAPLIWMFVNISLNELMRGPKTSSKG